MAERIGSKNEVGRRGHCILRADLKGDVILAVVVDDGLAGVSVVRVGEDGEALAAAAVEVVADDHVAVAGYLAGKVHRGVGRIRSGSDRAAVCNAPRTHAHVKVGGIGRIQHDRVGNDVIIGMNAGERQAAVVAIHGDCRKGRIAVAVHSRNGRQKNRTGLHGGTVEAGGAAERERSSMGGIDFKAIGGIAEIEIDRSSGEENPAVGLIGVGQKRNARGGGGSRHALDHELALTTESG